MTKIVVDLLDVELNNPHWLSPAGKRQGREADRAARLAKTRAELAEHKRRKRERVLGEAKTAADYDPNQPRDEIGRWTETGAGGASKSGAKINPQEGGTNLSPADQKVAAAAERKLKEVGVEKLAAEYKERYGKIINTDSARHLFEDVGYNGINAAAVHEPSSAVAKAAWRDALKNNPGDDAMIYAGGSGSGKTSAIEHVLPDEIEEAAAVLDGNLSSISSAEARIAEVAAAGKFSHVVYVYRDAADAWENGVIKRMLENPKEKGRVVRLSVFLDNTEGSLNTIKKLLGPPPHQSVKVTVIDNSRGKGKAAIVAPKNVAKLSHPSNLKTILEARTKELLQSGRISKEQYDELLK